MLKRTAQVLGLALASCLTPAWGLGLGEINVDSYLNQPLVATIPIESASREELESLKVSLAPLPAFERLGLDRHDYLLGLKFTVIRQGGPRILVTGRDIAREPFLSFVVDAEWSGGRLQREYTVLLDPPELAATREQPTAARPEPVSAATAAATPPSRPAPADAPAPAAARPAAPPAPPTPDITAVPPRTYGPVAPRETLWSIATRLRPDPELVTMNQMLIALFDANPQAFDGGLNGLRRGSVLTVPTLDEILAIDPVEAKRRVDAQRSAPPRPSATAQAGPETRPAPAAPADDYRDFDEVPSEPPAPEPADAEPDSASALAYGDEPAPEPALEPAPEPAPEPAAETPRDSAASPPAKPVAAAPGSALARLQELARSEEDGAATFDAQPEPDVVEPAGEESAGVTAETGAAPGAASDQASEQASDQVSDQVPDEAELEAEGAESGAVKPSPAVGVVPRPEGGDEPGLPWLLIGGGALLLFGAAGGWWWWRRRSESPASDSAPSPSPPPSPRPVVAAPVAESPEPRESAPSGDDAAVGPGETRAEQTQETDALQATQDIAAAEESAEATTQTEAEPELSGTGEDVDFDVTAQFASETMQINLDANDPLSEADFHLAYGLYDEAALLLQSALENEPQRQDLKVKLAETYFAGGKVPEFVEVARALKQELPDAEWQKIAIMGSQIAPDDPLFKDGGSGGDIAAGGVDLDFGAAPADTGDSHDAALSDSPEPAASDSAEAPPDLDIEYGEGYGESSPGAGDGTLEFDLDDFDLGEDEAAGEPVAESEDEQARRREPDAGGGAELSLDIDEAGLTPGEVETDAGAQEPAAADSAVDDGMTLDFDGLSLDTDEEPDEAGIETAGAESAVDESHRLEPDFTVEPPSPDDEDAAVKADAGEAALADDDFDLSGLSLDDEDVGESDSISGGDEISTKLDLARAYIDMGDAEMARGLLDEVVAGGSEAQKAEAEKLLGRLS